MSVFEKNLTLKKYLNHPWEAVFGHYPKFTCFSDTYPYKSHLRDFLSHLAIFYVGFVSIFKQELRGLQHDAQRK